MFKHASNLAVETRYSWVFNTGYLISFMQMAAVLKRDHSLKGKNPYRLIKLFWDWDRTDPAVLAMILTTDGLQHGRSFGSPRGYCGYPNEWVV